jgi:hypothetical protein
LPLWNPYIFAGQPLLANPQSALFYPVSILFCLLPLPAAFNLFTVLHFILSGIFAYLLLSRLHFSRSAAFMGSAALTFSSFLVYQVPAGHPAALSGFIWLPLVILLLSRVVDETIPFATILLGIVCSFQFLSGHTFPFFISLVFILIHALYYRGQYLKRLSAVFVIFAGLSALQLLPSLELSRLTETANWPTLVKSYSLSGANLLTALLPGIFGSVIRGNFLLQDNPSFFFEKYDLYFGLLPLFLSLTGIAIALREKRYFFPLLFLTGLFLSFGFSTPLYRLLYDHLPGFSYLRVPARFYYLCLIALIVMAASAWDAYIRQRQPWVKIALLCIVVADLFLWGKPFIYAQSMASYRTKNSLSECISPAYRIITEPDTIAPNKSMLYHHFNLNGYEAILLRDFTRYLGLREKQVFNATGLARADLESPLSRGFSAGYYLGRAPISGTSPLADIGGELKLFKYDKALPRVFFSQGVRVIPDNDVQEQIEYLRNTPYSPDQEILLPFLPEGITGTPGKGRVLSYRVETDKISSEILLNQPAIIVFSEMFYPGWKAYAAGKNYPLLRGNKVFRALPLPAGTFTGRGAVRLVYDPIAWRFGLFITVCSLLLLVLHVLNGSTKGRFLHALFTSRSVQ